MSNINNTYSGGTTVAAGTLSLANTFSTNNIASSSLINVGASGTLNLAGLNSSTLALAANQALTGPGTISGSVTGLANSIIAPGTISSGSAGTGASNISGGLTLAGNSNLNFGLNATNGTANTINIGGALSLPASGGTAQVALYLPNSTTPYAGPSGHDDLRSNRVRLAHRLDNGI